MAKTKSRWLCQECGFESSGYLGKCTDCGTWGSVVEELAQQVSAGPAGLRGGSALGSGKSLLSEPLSLLEDVDFADCKRLPTYINDVDEVLGGGLVPGGVILISGEPGIGKSTLLLQLAGKMAQSGKVLYFASEESKAQVKLRADRLGLGSAQIYLDGSHSTQEIAQKLSDARGSVAIIDSIQSIYHPQISSASGSVSQVRESAQLLIDTAKQANTSVILVGHVTKDGSIAGPRVLEHMVDVVLIFEGDRTRRLRVLRTIKNRFGSTQVSAIFTMTEDGLKSVDNPSELLLGERLDWVGKRQAPSGTAIISAQEGRRSLFLEVQALVANSNNYNNNSSPKRLANGWDTNRLLQIIAVLEKKVSMSLGRSDVYVNVVGGLDLNDPAGDLGVCIAIATSYMDRSLDPGSVFIGEIGLTAEIRPVADLDKRLSEAARLGFTHAYVPKANLPLNKIPGKIKVIGVDNVKEVFEQVMPQLLQKQKTQQNEFSPAKIEA